MTAEISRRSLLAAVAAITTSLPLVSGCTASAAGAAAVLPDARLLDLWDVWQASQQGIDRADEEMDVIHAHIDQLDLPKLRPRMSEAEERARSEAYAAAYEQSGYNAAEKRNEEFWDRLCAAQVEIGQGDAVGLLGVLLRVRVLASWHRVDIWGRETGLIDAVRHDLERLAAASGPVPTVDEEIERWHRAVEASVEESERERSAAGWVCIHD